MSRPPQRWPLRALAATLVAVALGASCVDSGPAPAAVTAAEEPAPGAAGAYRVELQIDDVAGRWRVTLNGFPIRDRTDVAAATRQNWIDPDLDVALVSGVNVVRAEVWPHLRRSGDALAVGPAALRGAVAEVGAGPVPGASFDVGAAQSEWERTLRARWAGWVRAEAPGESWALDSARAWVEGHPVAAAARFLNERGPSFDAVFRDAPVIGGAAADSARLRAYAVRLGALQLARDTAAAFAEFEPAFAARFAVGGGAAAIGMDSTALMARLRDQSIVAGPGEVPVTPAEVGLRSWAGGRVWELYRGAGDPLLDNLRVYVGEVGGALRVVR